MTIQVTAAGWLSAGIIYRKRHIGAKTNQITSQDYCQLFEVKQVFSNVWMRDKADVILIA